jgi:hypothetical protein
MSKKTIITIVLLSILLFAGIPVGKAKPVHKQVAVQFVETGLPAGTTWSVTLDSRTKSSDDGTIAFGSIDVGPHSFTIPDVNGYEYTATPSSGSLTVTGEDNPVRINVVFAVLTTTINVLSYRTMFQWRGWEEGRFLGDWLDEVIPGPSYLRHYINTYEIPPDYILTGNVLQKTIPISLYGVSGTLDYTYDKDTNLWIVQKDPISANAGDGYTCNIYFSGYLEFSGKPSASTFEHGVLYYWCYVIAPQGDTFAQYNWNGKWDSTVGAWLVNFSAYITDNVPQTYFYPIAFPTSLPEPSNYNPLGY